MPSTSNTTAATKRAIDEATATRDNQNAAYIANPTSVHAHKLYLNAEIALATLLADLDRSDVSPVRGVLLAELQAFLNLVAPVLAKPTADAVNAQIDALLKTASLPAATLAAAVARLAATYTACPAAYALVTANRTGVALPGEFQRSCRMS
jgi:hypothetical protein